MTGPLRAILPLVSIGLVISGPPASAADEEALANLRRALLLKASFDAGVDADFAVGERALFSTASGDRAQARRGLPDAGTILHVRSGGHHGGALHFTKKSPAFVFFRGEKNLGFTSGGWSGAVSFWLRLDPETDLEPGYCDPLQFVAQGWDEGNLFVEFSKDHTPRHFRFAILPVKKTWNPENRGWEEIPDAQRPMVAVTRPPFARNRWTHVVIVFSNINSGRRDGAGQLYLDGREQGVFKDWPLAFNWEIDRSALTIGLSYVGWFDDLAVFNRRLEPAEVRLLHQNADGLASLTAPASR